MGVYGKGTIMTIYEQPKATLVYPPGYFPFLPLTPALHMENARTLWGLPEPPPPPCACAAVAPPATPKDLWTEVKGWLQAVAILSFVAALLALFS